MELNKRKIIFFNFLIVLAVFILLSGLLEIGLRLIGRTSDNFLKPDSVLGWAHQPNVKGWSVTGEYRVPVYLNHFGLVGPEVSLAKPERVSRVAAVGDSVTEAFQVEPEQAYPRLLEKTMNQSRPKKQVEVLNFGVTSYGTVKEEYVLENSVFQFKPDMILLGFFVGNDFSDNLAESINVESRFSPWQEFNNRWKLWLRNHAVLYRWFLYQKSHNRFFHAAIETNQALGNQSQSGTAMEKTKIYLKKFKTATDQQKIPLLVLILPSKEQVYPQVGANGSKPANKILIDFLSQERIAHLDLLPVFQDWAKINPAGETFFKLDGHPNAEGHQLIAKAVADYLKKNNERKIINF